MPPALAASFSEHEKRASAEKTVTPIQVGDALMTLPALALFEVALGITSQASPSKMRSENLGMTCTLFSSRSGGAVRL